MSVCTDNIFTNISKYFMIRSEIKCEGDHMAYAETLTSRECPTDMFSEIEKRTAAHVLKIVYGNEQEGEVDTRAHHGRPNTFMAMKVEIDSEDHPCSDERWGMTSGGVCVRMAAVRVPERKFLDSVPEGGLTDTQADLYRLHTAENIKRSLSGDSIWNSDIGWGPHRDNSRKLGVLVVMINGAWRASYSAPIESPTYDLMELGLAS
ncbi:hypothetical protein KA021_00250 [Candidatus Saccharibacteria bacterium]|jgi:hypothetical protein|nr:hypothetical protein [Candidatus Saccharibacteria bacterium]